MVQTYLIDVFNLLYKIPEIQRLVVNNQLLEAETLFLNRVLSFTNSNNCRCFLFFDGMNTELAAKWHHPNLKIIFCHPQSADDRMKAYIKNLYRQNALKNKTITVSDDHAILNFSRRFDGQTMSSSHFISLLDEAASLPTGKSKLKEKPDSPTDADIDEYMRLLAEDNRKKQADDNE